MTFVSTDRAFRLGVLGSGKGSNFVAIADACQQGRLAAEVAVVISDVPEAGILEHARSRGIPAQYLAPGKFRTKLDEAAEHEYVIALQRHHVDLIVLAGFMRIIKSPFLQAFPQRVVNIHPSLLPAFPGLFAWKQAWEYGVRYTGCTVHLVDAGVDSGPILGQRVVEVRPNDTPESLHARIQVAEHELYPSAIQEYLHSGRKWEGRRLVG